jgi:hypothetical protein
MQGTDAGPAPASHRDTLTELIGYGKPFDRVERRRRHGA